MEGARLEGLKHFEIYLIGTNFVFKKIKFNIEQPPKFF